MKRFSRTLALALTALMILGCWPALAGELPALVPIGTALHDHAELLRGAAVVDGAVYMLGYTRLLRWRPGEAAVQELSAAEPFLIDHADMLNPLLLSDGRELWRLEPRSGRLQRLIPEGDGYRAEKPIQLNWRTFTDEHTSPRQAVLMEGTLWLSREHSDGSVRLLRVKLQEGAKPTALKVRNLHAMVPAREGGLLALQYDAPASSRRLAAGKPALPVTLGHYDPRADRFTPRQELQLGDYPNLDRAALLDAGEALYLAAGDRIFRLSGQQQEACAALPGLNFISGAGQALWALQDRLLVVGEEQALLRTGDPTAFQQADRLVINGSFLTSQRDEERLALAMGDTALVYGPDQAERSQEELASAFLLNEVRSDVLLMPDYSFDLAALGRKGYLLDLSGSDKLRAYAESLDPKLQALMWQEGQLVMVPFDLMLIMPSAHQEPLRALGLPVPTDFAGVCDLAAGYQSPAVQQQGPLPLLGEGNLRDALTRMGVDLYFQTAHARGSSVRFEDPLFRRMMERVQALPRDASQGSGADGEYPLMVLGDTMDGHGWMRQEGSYPRAFDFLSLVAEEGLAPAVPATVRMLAVHSRTQAPQAAIRFLEEVVSLVSPRTLVLMRPGSEGPVLNPDYAHDVAATRQRIQMFEAIAQAAGSERMRRRYQQEAEDQRRLLERAEQEIRYLETADSVARVRAIADHMQLQTALMHSQQLALAATDLVGQYAKGLISLDQFIQQADGKLRLVELEQR